jgi:AcrR family transcriptional regulator
MLKPTVPTAAGAPRLAGADTAALRARTWRQRAVADARRALVLEAARATFGELGLDGASLREIARRAGYTPGALYRYFRSKEEVYAALLGESLDRLNACVGTAQAPPGTPARAVAHATLRAKATAFFEFYRERPRDLDLGFYLFHGTRPRGLTPVLNARLNARLAQALEPAGAALRAAGLDAAQAHVEATALFAHMVGLLLLGHTGRIRMFELQPQALLERYVDALVARTRARPARATA